ncbi:hypothetical protein FB479_102699 [Brevibacillus sp. AG162]|uniref:hypothetical protein n=1 Tax=Brevibacillus sp. AG162 TaxID=2572910 RepID=UPI00114F1F93|nr:hypothetical protein [Brevibacillus sp. AG162]TQK74059.1 hypothetical protein FB479_102699 [Brevibacillus sp. AG162]
MIEWINNNSGVIQSISAIVMMLLTAFYVRFTKKILEANEGVYKETETSRKLTVMPNVIAYFDTPVHNILNFNIANIGANVARNTKVELEYLNEIAKENEMRKTYILSEGISTLAPNQKLEMFFGTLLELKSKEGEFPKLNVHVTFEDNESMQYRATYTLDANMYKGVAQIHINGLHDLTKKFDKFENEFNKMSRDIRRHLSDLEEKENETNESMIILK